MKIFASFNSSLQFPADNRREGDDKHSLSWMSLPDSTLLRTGKKFYIPDFDTDFRAIPAIGIKIGRLGKNVSEKFTPRYFSEMTAGFVVAAENVRRARKRDGMPWAEAFVYDWSCWAGEFIPYDPTARLNVSLRKNSDESDVEEHILSLDPLRTLEKSGLTPEKVVTIISARNTIRIGDLIMMLIPGEEIPLKPGMNLEATLSGEKVFITYIK